MIRRAPRNLDFRTRTSLYLTAVVILPLIVFVLFVRAYLANRLEAEYLDRGQTALNAAQRVIEDYLASTTSTSHPEQVLDDDVLSWLARVIGHDLHLYRDDELDRVEPPRSLRRARRIAAPAGRRLRRHRRSAARSCTRIAQFGRRRSSSRSTARSTSCAARTTRWRCRSSCRGARSRRR